MRPARIVFCCSPCRQFLQQRPVKYSQESSGFRSVMKKGYRMRGNGNGVAVLARTGRTTFQSHYHADSMIDETLRNIADCSRRTDHETNDGFLGCQNKWWKNTM